MRETADCFLHGPYDAALVRCPHPDHARSDKFRCTPHSVAGAAKDAGGSAGAPPPAARRQPSPSTARDSDAVSETHADSPTVTTDPIADLAVGDWLRPRHGVRRWRVKAIRAGRVLLFPEGIWTNGGGVPQGGTRPLTRTLTELRDLGWRRA